ncbi:MAG: PQQ-binding-like beta-propeller repeat protein [Acidobacteriota bacterium]
MKRFERVLPIFLCALFSADLFAQNLLWEVVQDLSGGGTDIARAITLTRRSVVVIGNASNPPADVNDFVIQSLRRRSGAIRWTDRVDEVPGVLTSLQITSAQGRVFASGYVPGATAGDTDIVVRGYEAMTGAALWNSVWDTGRDDQPQAIVAGPGAVVVVGYGGGGPGRGIDFIVRAYDPASGAILWDDRVERPDLEGAAWTVAITRTRVFVAGNTLSPLGRDLLVRAYDAPTGALRWEIDRPSTSPVAMTAVAGRVFLAGSASNHSYVGAFDARRGTMLWEDEGTEPGNFRDLAVEGDRVVAAGSAGRSLLLRAYQVDSGSLQWEAPRSVPPGTELALTVALNDSTVYVGGSRGEDFAYAEVLVRGYDALTGAVLWDDRSHRSPFLSGTGAVGLALGKNRLFVAGSAQSVGTGTDFIIRAYDIREDKKSAWQVGDMVLHTPGEAIH